MKSEQEYERLLTTAIVDLLLTRDKANKYIDAAREQGDLSTEIVSKIRHILDVHSSEARTYIDYATGSFRPGTYLKSIKGTSLEPLYDRLKVVTTELHRYPFTTATEAGNAVTKKSQYMNGIIAEMRKALGDDRARGVAQRAKTAAINKTGISF